MHILVLNSGSSSIKFSLFDARTPTPHSLAEGEVSGIGTSSPKLTFEDAHGHDLLDHAATPNLTTIPTAIAAIEQLVSTRAIDAIGYRVVHPGPTLRSHTRITPEVLQQLRDAIPFAPLHDPTAIAIIEEMQRRFPAVPHFACFDTVFHQTMPSESTTYPIPGEFAAQGVRRYGFHGLSCESIVHQLRQSNLPFPRRLIIAHLGGGCSVTALADGQSIDTSMGLTPTGGIVMATRPGDLDPGLLLFLIRRQGPDAIEQLLNRQAGLAALSGISSDMREIRAAASRGNEHAVLALAIFTRSVKKQIGAYIALLGGLDALVFAGGIGEHDALSRQQILSGLDALNLSLDEGANQQKSAGLHRIDTTASSTAIYIVPAEEDLTIARHAARLSRTEP